MLVLEWIECGAGESQSGNCSGADLYAHSRRTYAGGIGRSELVIRTNFAEKHVGMLESSSCFVFEYPTAAARRAFV